jgi:hypothetical protein
MKEEKKEKNKELINDVEEKIDKNDENEIDLYALECMCEILVNMYCVDN